MRILHTMLRVGNLERSISFYQDVLDMRLLSRSDNEQFEYTLAFLGYDDIAHSTVLELTYNWGVENYDHGEAFGHIAIEVDNVYTACEKIKLLGYAIELIQAKED
jgi:lactoylglutathione lyase